MIYNKKWWTEEQIKDLKEKYFYYLEHKEEAEEHFQKTWVSITTKSSLLKITSANKNKECSMYLGYHVAERVLSHVFKDVEKMPMHNPGFDFTCNKGFKIDVKSSCLDKNNRYSFAINYNKIADYFLLIGFNNREELNPQHIWLMKSDDKVRNYRKLNSIFNVSIKNNMRDIYLFSKYELTDKLKETIECCNKLRNKTK